jgi:hypothetical protein
MLQLQHTQYTLSFRIVMGGKKKMRITTVSPYETSASEFFAQIKNAKAQIVVDVRLHATNQLCGYSKEGDLAYFIPTILGIPYVHDTRFAPEEGLLKSYLAGQSSFERYGEGYKKAIDQEKSLSLFEEAYGPYDSIVLVGTATRKRRSHAEVLKNLLEDKQNGK